MVVSVFKESLNEKVIKGKDAGNYVKMAKPGRTLKIDDDIYTALGKGKWKGPDGEKLSWIEVSSIASALGNKKVTYESKVNERAAMGYDGYTGLFYFEGVPFTQERLDEVIAWLKDTVIKAAKDLPSQFTYRPAIQIEDEVGGEQVTFKLHAASAAAGNYGINVIHSSHAAVVHIRGRRVCRGRDIAGPAGGEVRRPDDWRPSGVAGSEESRR